MSDAPGPPRDGQFEFFGERFSFNPGEDYQWEMLEFAEAATSGADSELLSGMAAVMSLLKAAITDDDWQRFRALAKKSKAQVKADLMPVVVKAFAQPTQRPTSRPSDSSDGPLGTPENSGDVSYLRVVKTWEDKGRPDVAYMVQMAQAARSAG